MIVGARRPFDKLRAVPSALLRDAERGRSVSEVEPRLAPTTLAPRALICDSSICLQAVGATRCVALVSALSALAWA
jgi:hypothetical protein